MSTKKQTGVQKIHLLKVLEILLEYAAHTMNIMNHRARTSKVQFQTLLSPIEALRNPKNIWHKLA